MVRFNNILAVYDIGVGSEAVLEQAVSLARATRGRLTVFALLDQKHCSRRDREEAQKRLDHIVPWIRQQGVREVSTAIGAGPAVAEIMRKVTLDKSDLVLLNADLGRGLPGLLFGSVATSLMRSCPCPVWGIKPGARTPCANVVAAIGGRLDGSAASPLNAAIVGAATEIARAQGATLHIVHAWAPQGDDAEMLKSEMPRDKRATLEQRCEARCRSAVNALLDCDALAGLDHEIHLPRGLPHLTIVDMAQSLQADVVVIGSDGDQGGFRLFGGGRADAILAGVGCGVLTVKLDGYQPRIAPFEQPARDLQMAAVGE